MSIKALVQQPYLGFRVHFRDPLFDLDKLDSSAAQAAFEAFRPWNITLENVTVKDHAANFAEEATSFALLGGHITFNVGPGGCGILVTNPSWSEADLIIRIGSVGIAAVLRATGAVVEKQNATITMHLTPTLGDVRAITAKYVNVDLLGKLVGMPFHHAGFSIYRDDLLWVVDKSVGFENSLFVRLDRSFGPADTLEQVAHQLNADERALLNLLGLEVD